MDAQPENPGGSTPLLRARGLSIRYGPIVALDGVDLDVGRGEVVALAGENGAGKSTLVRCIAGDIRPDSGHVSVSGHLIGSDPGAALRLGVAVVWQDLALCDNLDVASNVLLGRESRRLMLSDTRFHQQAAALLSQLGIDLPGTTIPVSRLSGGQRQLVAVARAMSDHPDLLILDEPTASLGVAESARVEQLAASLPAHGTSVLIVSHDVDQMFRLADRIVILRRGRVQAEINPAESHPDEVAAILSGQALDVSARRQLTRLHSLADQLATAEPSSSLSLIISALSAALGVEQLCVHVTHGDVLQLADSVGLTGRLSNAWSTVPVGPAGGPIGQACASGQVVVSRDLRTDPSWARYGGDARAAGVASSWSVPFNGAAGDSGVITVLGRSAGEPGRDDIELVALYAGHAASALERDRLLGEATTRNRVLETIREVLQALAGPLPVEAGLGLALRTLQAGLGATHVGLVTRLDTESALDVRCWAGPGRDGAEDPPAEVVGLARSALDQQDGSPAAGLEQKGAMAAGFPAPGGAAALVAYWSEPEGSIIGHRRALIDDAANSLRLALEREASERAQREAMALRSSQELQRKFLSWLSHELRTPLTAIQGYASSLLQPDVNWDGVSQTRFLERISAESARLGRLVADLLDFSAIDARILRLQPDWCDLSLVLEAARACLPAGSGERVEMACASDVPVVWADHDRLEQIFVNLVDNAIRHNPPGTRVRVETEVAREGEVTVSVIDDGVGIPFELRNGWREPRRDRRSRTGGAGLGLSIARGIVEAHGGRLDITPRDRGTVCAVHLPVALGAPVDGGPSVEAVPVDKVSSH